MIATTYPIQKPVNTIGQKTLVIIDFGNGDVKALVRCPKDSDGKSDWQSVKFPSLVAKLTEPQPGCFRIGNQLYLVGDDARHATCIRTGASDRGKIDNALPLLVHALRTLAGDITAIDADIVFTSPSVKQYGAAITEAIEGQHRIVTPADELAMITQQEQLLSVYKVIPQLEGHRAMELVKASIDSRAMLVDVGNRTIITTLLEKSGRIISRKAFDTCGVRGIASRVVTAESLAGVDGLKLTPSEEDVIGFLLSKKGRKAKELIEPQVMACISEVLSHVRTVAESYPVFLLGGGAELPGLAKLFGGKVISEPQWATVNGLKAVADALVERA